MTSITYVELVQRRCADFKLESLIRCQLSGICGEVRGCMGLCEVCLRNRFSWA